MKKLTKAEEEVMQTLWRIEEGVLKDIFEGMSNSNAAYNTIATVVRILCEKGFVGYKTYGKTNLYHPIVSKEDYSSAEVKGVIQKYFNNSPKNLLSYLIKEKDINLKELDEIIKTIEKE